MSKNQDGGVAQSRSGQTRNQALKQTRDLPSYEPGVPQRAPFEQEEPGAGSAGIERLNKALARAGVASRRHVDELIRAGKVKLNGEVVVQLGVKVDPHVDRVQVHGHRVPLLAAEAQVKLYFLLNKPAGVLTTVKDDRGRRTVMDLVAGATEGRIYPVGRLDYDAEGALLLTNDGDLAAKLMSPKQGVAKVYQVKVKGDPPDDKLDILRRGVRLEDGVTRPCSIEVFRKARVNTWLEVTLTEGKNRQLKRMFWRIRHPVLKIVRVAYGPVTLKDVEPGQFRELSRTEVEKLKRAVE
jgi:pseudouridine synthase